MKKDSVNWRNTSFKCKIKKIEDRMIFLAYGINSGICKKGWKVSFPLRMKEMKRKIIVKEITQCVDCDHANFTGEGFHCKLSDKKISFYYSIPDWCKLEDVVKVKK